MEKTNEQFSELNKSFIYKQIKKKQMEKQERLEVTKLPENNPIAKIYNKLQMSVK